MKGTLAVSLIMLLLNMSSRWILWLLRTSNTVPLPHIPVTNSLRRGLSVLFYSWTSWWKLITTIVTFSNLPKKNLPLTMKMLLVSGQAPSIGLMLEWESSRTCGWWVTRQFHVRISLPFRTRGRWIWSRYYLRIIYDICPVPTIVDGDNKTVADS